MKKLALSAVLAVSFAFGVDYKNLVSQCSQGIFLGERTACDRLESLCNKKDGEACHAKGSILEHFLTDRADEMSEKQKIDGSKLMLNSYARGCKYGSQGACKKIDDIKRIFEKYE